MKMPTIDFKAPCTDISNMFAVSNLRRDILDFLKSGARFQTETWYLNISSAYIPTMFYAVVTPAKESFIFITDSGKVKIY
jgi:hypothetical protein